MPSRYRHRRTFNPTASFPTPVEPGEIIVNTANRQLAVGDADATGLGTPLLLLPVRVFDPRAQYAAGDFVVSAADLYRAKTPVAPGAFSPAQWDLYSADAAFQAQISSKVAKAGDTMTGHLVLPTGPAAANAVRKDYVDAALAGIDLTPYAPKASPVFTGNPTAPTPAANDNDTSIATTAFVTTAVAAVPAAPAAATAAEYVANSAPTKMLTPGAVWSAAGIVTLTDAATVTPNLSLGIDFVWSLGATGRTLANPTGGKPGQKGLIHLVVGSSGGITTWGSSYKFPGGTKPVLSAGLDIISYAVGNDSVTMYCSHQADFK